MSVMIETIGSRNLRWLQRKRDDFLMRNSKSTKGTLRVRVSGSSRASHMPHNIIRQNSRLQHAVSSLSSSSGSTAGSGTEEEAAPTRKAETAQKSRVESKSTTSSAQNTAKKVSCSSSSNDTRKMSANDFHDYHAPSLPDPLLDSGESDSPHDGDSDHCVVTSKKHISTDSSSGDDVKDGNAKDPSGEEGAKAAASSFAKLPPNIARKGGISHNVTVATAMAPAATLPNGHAQLIRAPVTALPPFAGIGKKAASHPSNTSAMRQHSNDAKQNSTSSSSSNQPFGLLLSNHVQNDSKDQGSRNCESHFHSNKHQGNIITIENDTTSSQSSSHKNRGIQAYYHINEDDMVMTDDVLMCPFTFRSMDAVWCGALAECVMPGMLRACFSANNKLKSVEMIFDAMGFCQQLEHASGNLGMAQIIPNCLEMVSDFCFKTWFIECGYCLEFSHLDLDSTVYI